MLAILCWPQVCSATQGSVPFAGNGWPINNGLINPSGLSGISLVPQARPSDLQHWVYYITSSVEQVVLVPYFTCTAYGACKPIYIHTHNYAVHVKYASPPIGRWSPDPLCNTANQRVWLAVWLARLAYLHSKDGIIVRICDPEVMAQLKKLGCVQLLNRHMKLIIADNSDIRKCLHSGRLSLAWYFIAHSGPQGLTRHNWTFDLPQ